MDAMEVPAVRKLAARRGFTLLEMMLVVTIIALLMAIATPSFVRARDTARTNACMSNLKAIDGAKTQWAMEYRKSDGEPVSWNELAPSYMKAQVKCPWGYAYTLQPIGTPPYCPVVGHHVP
jgi:prepilin-type N-terminal cleavage/methylation domain-containing protein